MLNTRSSRRLARGVWWTSAALLLLAAGCSGLRLTGPWPIPERPDLGPGIAALPALPGRVACLAGALADATPREACPEGSSVVVILPLEAVRALPAWHRDQVDGWAMARARVADYVRQTEGLIRAINRPDR